MRSIEYRMPAIVQAQMRRVGWFFSPDRWVREGSRTTAAAFAATLFYGVPLLFAVFAAAPAIRPPQILLDAVEGSEDRIVTFLSLPTAEADPGELAEEAEEEEEIEAPEEPKPQKTPAPKADVSDVAQGDAQGEPEEATVESGRPALGTRVARGVRTVSRPSGSASSRPRKTRNCNEPHPNIRTAPDGVMEIDRTLVDEYTRNLEAFMSLGYSRPYDENNIKGWYISGFPCTSPVQKAGFRRGDVLLRVNGKPTRSWVGVYFLYQRLKNKDEFEIELMRKGQPVRLHFRVVG